jgi:hypothetical protein
VIGFGTPKGVVKVRLNVAEELFPMSDELFDAAYHLIDGDVAKTYSRPH